jgi:hypothetical protein
MLSPLTLRVKKTTDAIRLDKVTFPSLNKRGVASKLQNSASRFKIKRSSIHHEGGAMRPLLMILVPLLAAASFSGCGPAVSDDQLGEIHYTMPAVPGAEKPYELPELDEAEPEKAEGQ